MRCAGVLSDSAGLDDPETATVLRMADGMLTDGPYAESTEQLGAFFHIDVADLDAALDLARQMPVATDVRVEIRPTFD